MSLSRSGITHDTVGRLAKLVGKLVSGLLFAAGTFEKSVHGACLRAYSPDVQTSDPVEGKPSEYPANVLWAAVNSLSRFTAEKERGQESSTTPCVDPEKSAR